MVAQKVAVGVYKGVTTSELDELAAETSASMTATHPDYALVHVLYSLAAFSSDNCRFQISKLRFLRCLLHHASSQLLFQATHPLHVHIQPTVCFMQLAARIAVSNLHKNTLKSFSET